MTAESRIHVDARMLGGEGTGVSTYARTLIAAIERSGRSCGLLHADRPTGPVRRLFRATRGTSPLCAEASDLVGRDIFRLAQRRFDLTGTMLQLRAPGPPGVMHWTYPVPLRIAGWKNLYTVHDVIPLTHPDLSPVDSRRQERLLRLVAVSADRILTVSATARDAILKVLACPPDMVTDGGSAILLPDRVGALPAGRTAGGYLIFCGRIEQRKNLLRLIAAYRLSGVAIPLLLAGPLAEGGEAVIASARDTPGVEYLGYRDRDELVALLAHARALLFPSLAEGFGLPLAEAMALGTPAMISHDPALQEVAGGAALTVAAHDEAGMGVAIRNLCENADLSERLKALGKARAAHFSIEVFAERLDALYRDVEKVR